MNKVICTGNVVKKPELKEYHTATKTGCLTKGSIAVRESKDETYFFDFVAFDNTAKLLNGYCEKGTKIAIEGKLQTNTWTDNQGNNHSKVEIFVERMELLSPKPQTQQKQNVSVNDLKTNDPQPTTIDPNTEDFPF